ncbi:LOW QUALITY PROTEIN: uncharacterized protein LOC111050663 [Nilaparvata lugens]|uniref:LOW QUALITY PROTEIN: uncharacterized protein LOC111050663 n=1 Tax=Nilaparvata lugens TaxID=108931 RepID=UPI00193CCD3D|nr:LOW QUALITY PROTEIN: uncharacterized protein LOC111050663 [Nilaparvata lugens]
MKLTCENISGRVQLFSAVLVGYSSQMAGSSFSPYRKKESLFRMALAAPSMVHRSGDALVVRSVVSGDALFGTNDQLQLDIDKSDVTTPDAASATPAASSPDEDAELPQCKIKRNYACAKCTYYTQNPRFYLYHLKNVHKEKIKIYECPSCLYASKHSQKLQRHVHMVHVMGTGRRKVSPKPKPVTPKGPGRPVKRKAVDSDPEELESESDKLPDEEENNDEGECEAPLLLDADADADSDAKLTKCSLCPFTSRSQTLVSRHERVVHLKKKFFRCMKCNYVTHMKARYTKHVKYHSMPMIKCEMCDFRTPYKWNLDRHNKNHTGDGAFKCSLCNFTADIKQSLTVHEMNHHVPPVGQSAPTAKRRNRVGASDSLLNGHQESNTSEAGCQDLNTEDSENPLLPKSQIMIKKPKPFTNFSLKDMQGKLVENAVDSKDMLQNNNASIFGKRLKCRVCDFRSTWENEMSRHESMVHGLPEKKKSAPRPIPNLIPIQNKAVIQPNNVSAKKVVDKILSSKNENPMSEKDLNDIYAKSCSNSALKDFASLIGDSDAFKTNESETFNTTVNSTSSLLSLEKKDNEDGRESCSSPIDFSKTPEAFKKKNASFFDKLKEKLMNGVSEGSNMVCNFCGYESKCLSESVRHQKLHLGKGNGGSQMSNGNSQFSGAELSSTRCQHCRQRCKTSSDLFVHLQSCSEANRKDSDHFPDEMTEDSQASEDRREFNGGEYFRQDESVSSFDDAKSEPHPMENKVFVWNSLPDDRIKDEVVRKSPGRDAPLVGVETAPGYGAVTSKNKSGSQGHNIPNPKEKNKSEHSLKKVYKCPHCSFWASTASRFHVHIVGHLNKKPFECSLCAYRSNWRWDITKHIRLKTVRDVSHERARVLMTDETGRRNYSKYNKYLTLMRVQEPTAESSGSGRRTKSLTDSEEHSCSSTPPPPLSPAAPPRLTPALRPISDLPPKAAHSKPPPLQAAFQSANRSQDDATDEPPKKKSNSENKKTMWKCKKCFFRDGDRAVVLAHVKEHYRNQHSQAKADGQKEARTTVNDTINNNQFNSGNMNSIVQRRESSESNCDKSETGSTLKCPSCPFYADSHALLADHIFNHDSVDDVFRCLFCTFQVDDRQKLMEHMAEHGVQGLDSKSIAQTKKQFENGENCKRYQCSGCPYVSNSKSQFLYHKQFHRPRGAPFKCTMCSYNVTRRHLLHQHLRVHGVNVPTQQIIKEKDDIDSGMNPITEIKPIDTSHLRQIPLVWVSKLGNLTKMFKCRFCPHVNIRKSNIQEHEKMHGQRSKTTTTGAGEGTAAADSVSASAIHQQQHHCPDCNYVCNNAGVLSSHGKVHQGLFGQVCSLVDKNRSDEVQIKELNALLGRDEEGPPIITPEEMKKDQNRNAELSLTQTAFYEKPEEYSNAEGDKLLRFCAICPARFLFQKELDIHSRFHNICLPHRCESCSYTAKQHPHLLAHYKVHTDDYQDRTSALLKMYSISSDHPKPKIAVIVDGPADVGPAWVVVQPPNYSKSSEDMDCDDGVPDTEQEDVSQPDTYQHGNRTVHKQFACLKCPARFFKGVALQYHTTLHGGSGRFKCRSCDYAVKTYGNLIKHESVHNQLEPRFKAKPKFKRPDNTVPTSGTELFKHKTEAQRVAASPHPPPPPPPPPLHIDPEFGVLMHGSPEFIYPTYLKNGRMKEKRYKCHKCPSAFEKREQYKVHLSLHGSKQRYNCERCDYSVKYYANYIQHLKKHQTNDMTKAERKLSTDKNSDGHLSEDLGENTDGPSDDFQGPPLIFSQRSAKSMQMSLADQQIVMLLQQRVVSSSVSPPEATNRCTHCPYSNVRRDGVGSHARCHSDGNTGAFSCKHCSYTVPQHHFLREHNKLHFTPTKSMRPEAYMKCDRLELWSEPINSTDGEKDKLMIFKDKGNAVRSERFLPKLSSPSIESDEEGDKLLVNMKTGEIENDLESNDGDSKEDNKENLVAIVKQDKESPTTRDLCTVDEDEKLSHSPMSDRESKFTPKEELVSATEESEDSLKNDQSEHVPVEENGSCIEDQTTTGLQTLSCDNEETTSGSSSSSNDNEDESISPNSCSSTED